MRQLIIFQNEITLFNFLIFHLDARLMVIVSDGNS